MRKPVMMQPVPYNLRRRFPEWMDPPACCDVCQGPVVLVRNDLHYGRTVGTWPFVYSCLDCGAMVGCHPHSVYPLGLMADKETRQARAALHGMFDPLWESGDRTRNEAYLWLAGLLGLPPSRQVHFGAMDLAQCLWATELIRQALIVEDFGSGPG